MKTLRLSSFGMRGFVGESLTPRMIIDFGCAFATFIEGGRVLIGRDTRYSSPMIHSAVVASLLSAGCEIIDLGVCPTPMLQYSVKFYGAAGAISITGGHNSAGWNAIMLIGRDGAFIEPLGGEKVLDLFHASSFLKKDWAHMGNIKESVDFVVPYFRQLQKQLNTDKIRAANFTVIIDPVGGAGCGYLELFAEHLGLRLVPVNARPSGYLAREAEPRPRSALQMASIIKYVKADIGFVHSSDMGRMSIVTEDGEPASEEYSLPLIALHLLEKKKGTVVTNSCTTRTLDDVCQKFGVPIVKTRVGQANIVSRLTDEQGILGGEGSGSAVLPSFSAAFDGFLMMGLILEAMAEKGRPISEMLRSLPRYHIVKKQIAFDPHRAYQILENVQRQFRHSSGKLDQTDGLRVDWEDGWIHVRLSHTQQVLRIISEAKTRVLAEEQSERISRLVG